MGEKASLSNLRFKRKKPAPAVGEGGKPATAHRKRAA
jgi:hypothetical protein